MVLSLLMLTCWSFTSLSMQTEICHALRTVSFSICNYSVFQVSTTLNSSGFEFQFGMMSYGEPWKVRRSLFKKHFNYSNAQIYQVPEIKYIHRLLVSFAQRPADFVEHIQQYVIIADYGKANGRF